jgi:hypothetical protein
MSKKNAAPASVATLPAAPTSKPEVETTVKVTRIPTGVSGKVFTKATAEGKTPKAPKEKKEKAPKAAKEPKPKKEKLVRPPSYLAKIERMEAALPSQSKSTQAATALIAQLNDADLAATIAHAMFMQKRRGVVAAAIEVTTALEVGQTVMIMSGPAKHIGKTGTLTEVRRIRCFVEVEGSNTPVYLFTSDVKLTDQEEASSDNDANSETVVAEDEDGLLTEATNILDISDEAPEAVAVTG